MFCSVLILAVLLGGCETLPEQRTPATDEIRSVLDSGDTAVATVSPPAAVERALLPPTRHTRMPVQVPRATFDVAVNKVPARQFFMSLVEGTSENMVVHPDVTGTLTLDLKNVTVDDVLKTVQDVYGYQYRHTNGIYQVFPARMRSRVFNVEYLDVKRKGGSRTRVSSGQITQAPLIPRTGAAGRYPGAAGGGLGGTTSPGAYPGSGGYPGAGNQLNSGSSGTQVSTRSETDFWGDLKTSLSTLIGEEEGRKVITNPMSGTVLVRAMPRELMDVERYLESLEQAVTRQVIIEAKIIEVRLSDGFQSGVNWNALISLGNSKEIQLGQGGGGTVFNTGLAESAGSQVALDTAGLAGSTATAFGGVFALKAHLGDFNTLIELLKSQGDVQVLSSPRVSTMNNQKAIIKVGTDSYFVTDVDINTDTSASALNQSADITLTPFFSGVALDVTPQIDDDSTITLHVHPAISEVNEEIKDISISDQTNLTLPLATSTIRESDTIIRARSGEVVVIGGLMQNTIRDQVASTPFLGDLPVVGTMFRHTRQTSSKTELVILLRPVVVERNQAWVNDIRDTVQRFESTRRPQ